MSKRALLVGINVFARPEWQLRGCVNDTLALQQLLKRHFEFQDDAIMVIHDAAATTRGIRAGLAWLLSNYASGDVRIFYIASHGTQVPDQDGDEWECADEAIVPHDHDWNAPFRDDDLRVIFDAIPAGVNFTFIADCCHSGTIQKGLLDAQIAFTPRYLTPPQELTNRIADRQARRDTAADTWVAGQLAQMLQNVPASEWAQKVPEYLAQLRQRFRENTYAVAAAERHVLLAACADHQTAADASIAGEFRGLFTWALCQAITDANGDITHEQLIARASAALSSYEQQPQLECPPALSGLKLFAPLA
jgi:metacaspase-1